MRENEYDKKIVNARGHEHVSTPAVFSAGDCSILSTLSLSLAQQLTALYDPSETNI